MTKGTTMKIVGYFACNPDTLKPEWGEDCVCQDDVYNPEETGTIGRPFVFADQVLEDAAMVRRNTLLAVLGKLNSNPYNLTKSECIDVVREMFEEADAVMEQ